METQNYTRLSLVTTGIGPQKMPEAIKKKLRNRKNKACSICNSKRSYTNPVWPCFECKKQHCFNHLWAALFKDGMKQSELLRDVCDACKAKYGYRQL
jgi:hypothetical protein